MKLPVEIDTAEWALAQERVFAGEAESESVMKFSPLMLAQEKICPTNLTLRNRLILIDAAKWMGPEAKAFTARSALNQFHTIHKDGYWVEGYSYWLYTLVGLEWYRKRHGLPPEITEAMERITASYEAIKPCPLPEVRDLGEPKGGLDYVSTPSYFCKRWKNPDGSIRAYLLIALSTEVDPRNLHSHLEAGYFAFWTERASIKPFIGEMRTFTDAQGNSFRGPIQPPWTRGTWLQRCKPYSGFNFQESLTSSSLSACLPKGAMPPTWRVKPPKVTAIGQQQLWRKDGGFIYGSEFKFTWNNGLFSRQTRTIEVLPDKVVVTDSGLFRKSRTTEYGV